MTKKQIRYAKIIEENTITDEEIEKELETVQEQKRSDWKYSCYIKK